MVIRNWVVSGLVLFTVLASAWLLIPLAVQLVPSSTSVLASVPGIRASIELDDRIFGWEKLVVVNPTTARFGDEEVIFASGETLCADFAHNPGDETVLEINGQKYLRVFLLGINKSAWVNLGDLRVTDEDCPPLYPAPIEGG